MNPAEILLLREDRREGEDIWDQAARLIRERDGFQNALRETCMNLDAAKRERDAILGEAQALLDRNRQLLRELESLRQWKLAREQQMLREQASSVHGGMDLEFYPLGAEEQSEVLRGLEGEDGKEVDREPSGEGEAAPQPAGSDGPTRAVLVEGADP